MATPQRVAINFFLHPLLIPEVPDGESRREYHQADGEQIAQRDGVARNLPHPVQLGHKVEVHTVDTRDKRRGHEDNRCHRENLYNLILLDVNKAQSRILYVIQTL